MGEGDAWRTGLDWTGVVHDAKNWQPTCRPPPIHLFQYSHLFLFLFLLFSTQPSPAQPTTTTNKTPPSTIQQHTRTSYLIRALLPHARMVQLLDLRLLARLERDRPRRHRVSRYGARIYRRRGRAVAAAAARCCCRCCRLCGHWIDGKKREGRNGRCAVREREVVESRRQLVRGRADAAGADGDEEWRMRRSS